MSSGISREKEPGSFNAVTVLEAYEQQQATRHSELVATLGQTLPFVADVSTCNGLFVRAGHHNLVISEKATMLPITDIKDLLQPNNFSQKFVMYVGDSLIGAEQFDAALNRTLEISPSMRMTHLGTPAFYRMAAVCPAFTSRLVMTLNQSENQNYLGQFLPELFVAYQIMAELVDTGDPWVLSDDTVNEWYLHA